MKNSIVTNKQKKKCKFSPPKIFECFHYGLVWLDPTPIWHEHILLPHSTHETCSSSSWRLRSAAVEEVVRLSTLIAYVIMFWSNKMNNLTSTGYAAGRTIYPTKVFWDSLSKEKKRNTLLGFDRSCTPLDPTILLPCADTKSVNMYIIFSLYNSPSKA
jgi:hypothetical protein